MHDGSYGLGQTFVIVLLKKIVIEKNKIFLKFKVWKLFFVNFFLREKSYAFYFLEEKLL